MATNVAIFYVKFRYKNRDMQINIKGSTHIMQVKSQNGGKPMLEAQGIYLRHLIRADVRPCKLTREVVADIIEFCHQSDSIEEIVEKFPQLRDANWFSDSSYIAKKKEPHTQLLVPNKVKFSQAIEIMEKLGLSDAEFVEIIGANDQLLATWKRHLRRGEEDGRVWSLAMNAAIITLIVEYNADIVVKKSRETAEIVAVYGEFEITKQEADIGSKAGLSVGDILNMKTHGVTWKMLEDDVIFAHKRGDLTSLRGLLHFRMTMSELEELKQFA